MVVIKSFQKEKISWFEITDRVSSTWRSNVYYYLLLPKRGLLTPPNDIKKTWEIGHLDDT